MSELTDKYSKNFSPSKKKEFEKRVRDLAGQMSEESAIDLVLKELFDEKLFKNEEFEENEYKNTKTLFSDLLTEININTNN